MDIETTDREFMGRESGTEAKAALRELVKAGDAAVRTWDVAASMYIQHRCKDSERGKCLPESPKCGVWDAIEEKRAGIDALNAAVFAAKKETQS